MRKYTFREHFQELKNRLFIVCGSFIILFFLCYLFSDEIYKIILSPLAAVTPDRQRKIIYTGMAEAFFSYIKLSAFAAFICIFPLCCYQIYAFIKPGLHNNERRLISKIMLLSPILFYCGCFFMFFAVMPKAWMFFASYENNQIGLPLILEARISEYLALVIQLSLAFGICFQLPVFILVLAIMGLINSDFLKSKRRIAIVLIFILAAIFTPPDVFSQFALAMPLFLLYEISILLCVSIEKRFLENDRY